jgi:hypothetical protein
MLTANGWGGVLALGCAWIALTGCESVAAGPSAKTSPSHAGQSAVAATPAATASPTATATAAATAAPPAAAASYQWPGIYLKANPPNTYSTVIISTSGRSCRTTSVTVGFDGHRGQRVYSCRSHNSSQTWDYHPRFSQADIGPHTITVTVGDQTSTHSFEIPAR